MKKALSILMALLLMAGICAVSVSAADTDLASQDYWIAETPDIAPEDIPGEIIGRLGDTDNSQTVNVKDATSIQKFVASLIEFKEDVKALADTDFSGDITVRDATAVQKHIASLLEESLISNYVYKAFAPDSELIGSWETSFDTADAINALIASFAEDPFIQDYIGTMVPGFDEYYLIPQHINIESFPLEVVYTFKEDNSYIITYNDEALNIVMEGAKEDLSGDLESLLKAYAKEKDLPLSPNQIVSLMGYNSVDALVEEMLPADMVNEMAAPVKGYYRTAPGGKLYMDEYSDTIYETYEIKGDTLTITGTSEEFPEDDIFAGIVRSVYPMTFTKMWVW